MKTSSLCVFEMPKNPLAIHTEATTTRSHVLKSRLFPHSLTSLIQRAAKNKSAINPFLQLESTASIEDALPLVNPQPCSFCDAP